MRILHITDTMDYPTGVSRYIREVTDLFRSKGHVADVWSPPGVGDDVESLLTRWIGYRYTREVQGVLREGRYDILHAHNLLLRLSPLPLRAARDFGIPVAMTVHDFALLCPRKWMINHRDESCESGFGGTCLVHPCRSSRMGPGWLPYHHLRWLKTAFHRLLLRRFVNLFLCPSRILCDGITRSLKSVRAVHLPNFVSLPSRREGSPSGERLVYAGRLSVEKGIHVLLSAMPRILQRYPQASLTIIGDGPARGELEGLSARLALQGRVFFTGSCESGEIARSLQEASLAILPSLWFENGPMFALEALAAGTPLIGSRAGGLSEIIRDGQNGYLFQRGHAGDLAGRILQALGDPHWLSRARDEARRTAEEEYSPNRHYEQLMIDYASIARKQKE